MVKRFSKLRFLGISIDVKALHKRSNLFEPYACILDIDEDDISLAELANRCRKKRQFNEWEEKVSLAKLARYLKNN